MIVLVLLHSYRAKAKKKKKKKKGPNIIPQSGEGPEQTPRAKAKGLLCLRTVAGCLNDY